jgi:hypothetical protein
MKNYFCKKECPSTMILNFRYEDMEHDTLQRRSMATIKNMGKF